MKRHVMAFLVALTVLSGVRAEETVECGAAGEIDTRTPLQTERTIGTVKYDPSWFGADSCTVRIDGRTVVENATTAGECDFAPTGDGVWHFEIVAGETTNTAVRIIGGGSAEAVSSGSLDTRTGVYPSMSGCEPLVYDPSWIGAATCTVRVNGETVVENATSAGSYDWRVAGDGTCLFELIAGETTYSVVRIIGSGVSEGTTEGFVDTRSGAKVLHAGETETIAYSPFWNAEEFCSLKKNGETIIATNGEGCVVWTPQIGSYELVHTAGGETQSASFHVFDDTVAIHTGIFGGTETWSNGTVHVVASGLTVTNGQTLVIESGAVVKFLSETSLTVAEGGRCTARGVIFTHVADDSKGGDLFRDGAAEVPENDYWVLGYIEDDAATEYRYAQRSMNGTVASDSEWEANRVYVIDGVLTVPEGVSLTIPQGTIVKFTDDSKLVVEDGGICTAEGAIFTHVADDTAGGDTMGDGTATSPQYGKYTVSGNVVDNEATEYRYSASIVLSGTISENTTWRARGVYRITGNLTIANGATLTIQPGVVVKFADGVSMTVNSGGTLDAIGTRASPIVFTSIKDDEYGGDTNGDGDETKPYPGDWARIYAGGTINMTFCRIANCNNTSDQGAIQGTGGTVKLNNCLMESSVYELVRMNSGSFVAYNSIFRDASMAFGWYGGSGTKCYNCVVADVTEAVRASGKYFYNTIFYRVKTVGSTSSSYDHCCFYNPPDYSGSVQSFSKVGSNDNFWSDPLFADADVGDYSIPCDSPCVDTGSTSCAPSKDYFGQPRVGAAADIGIYEAMPRYVASDVDLRVNEVNVAGTGVVGDEVVVSWVVENNGTAATYDTWRDKVEIVSSRGDKVELGEKLIKTGLAAGGKRTFSSRLNLPVLAEGEYTVQVTVNYARDVFEGTLTENNIGSSASFAVTVPTAEASGGAKTVVRGGEEGVLHFTIDPASSDRLITITATEGMYALFGTAGVPTESYNVGKASASEGTICFIVPDKATDVYVRLVNGSDEDVECEMSFSTAKVKILDVSPRTVPYDGKVTVRVEGAGLNRVKSVAFKAADATLVPCVNWRADSSAQIVVSADGTLLAQGAEYRIALMDENGEETDSEQRVSVTQEPARPQVWAKMKVPETVRDGRQYLCTIEYGNKGNADAVAPILQVSVGGGGQLKLTSDETLQKNLLFIGAGASDNAGVLVPGESKKIEFMYIAGSSSDSLRLSVGENGELAAAAERMALRGEDATDYFAAKELAEKIAAGEPCGVYYGYVRDADGYPVSGYYVTITNGETNVGAVTDANGHYVTEACRDGDDRVDCSVSDVSTYAYVEVLGGSNEVVCVTAYNCETGVSIEGEYGSDGLYRFRGIEDGVYRVSARQGERLASGIIVVSACSFYPLSLTLSEPCRIQGTFTGDGLESAPAVLLSGCGLHRIVEVGTDGAFAFESLPAGTYFVGYADDNFADYTATNELVVADGETGLCEIVKTNNISAVESNSISLPMANSSVCKVNAVLSSASGPVTRNNIEEYMLILSSHAPSPPTGEYNCSHNRRRYQSAMKMYRYMNNTLLKASITKSELEQVERELALQWVTCASLIMGPGLSRALEVVKWSNEVKLAINLLTTATDASLSVADILWGEFDGKLGAVISPASLFVDKGASTMAILEYVRTLDVNKLKREIAALGHESYLLSQKLKWAEADVALISKLGKLMDCLGSFVSVLQLIKTGMDRTRLLNQKDQLEAELGVLLDYINRDIASVLQSPSYPLCCPECPAPVTTPPVQTNDVKKVMSVDPNEVAGPIGLGDPNTERFMRPGEWMTYTVYFENASNATAGAQEVFVTNPLSEWLDWDTFEMGEVAFANQIDTGLSGLQVGQSEVDFADTAYRVQSNVSINRQTGVVDWYLRLVDPSTASTWPADPYAGFLLPNDETHCGEGHLTYRVKIREDAPRNVVIENAASIVFDYNEAIATDPSWWNTVGWPLTVGEALNSETLTWTTGGATNWVPVLTENAPDTNHLAIAYGGMNDTNVWLSTEVNGPGTITFAWSSQLAARNTKGYFLVDGEVEAILTGTNDWVTATVAVWGEGVHILEWRLNTGRSGAVEGDALALDAVDWAAKTLVPPTLAEALNAGLKWSTTGEATWRGVARGTQCDSREAWAAVDGLGDLECAAVETRVYGTGTLQFDWAVSCEEEYDELVLVVDGKQRKRITGNVGWRTVAVSVEGTSWHTVRWEYVKDELDEEELVGDNRAMLDNVVWTSDDETPRNTEQTPVPVPYEVIDSSYKTYLEAAGGDYEAAALSIGKNGVAIWESYVAGLDPEDEKSKFTAAIEIVKGEAKVTWKPDLNEDGSKSVRKYTTLGCENLGDGWKDMGEVLEADRSKYRFFKVTVEMP